MDEELLDGFEQRSVAGVTTRHETRKHEALQRGMNFGGTDRQVDAHLGHRRARPAIAQQFHENQDVLRTESGLGHSVFAIRKYRIAQLEVAGVTADGQRKSKVQGAGPAPLSRHVLARYDREQLYSEVWSDPAQKVAERYAVSGVFLGECVGN